MIKKRLKDGILLSLEKAIDGWVVFEEFYDNPRKFVLYGPPYEIRKSVLSLALRQLREKGFIEKKKDEGKLILQLTEAGRDWLLKHKLDDQIEWDGIWRLVIFDIPEKHKRVRNILRRRLKEWGFISWQKSVWASKKPLTGVLRHLAKQLGIEDWILIIESSNTGRR